MDTDEQSIVQPGAFIGNLPQPLTGQIEVPPKAVWEGIYSDIYQGFWISGGEETRMFVCLKYLRKVQLDSKCPYTPQERISRRLRREAFIWEGAKHPNIYPFIGYAIVDEAHYLVSPWAEHGSLEKYLKDNPKTSNLQQATRGLDYLHAQDPPIIHGDIKPANILIRQVKEDNGGKENKESKVTLVATLCDFGVSRVMVKLGLHTGMTTAGGSPGTSGYQAKELVEEDDHYGATPRSDIYAMGGVILTVTSPLY
ncbi:hypothetical protein FRC00_003523 [Tulasnella sp. 408]|nr:hypothetical protein FRC00_003523 [Tulasnella sp. 408]